MTRKEIEGAIDVALGEEVNREMKNARISFPRRLNEAILLAFVLKLEAKQPQICATLREAYLALGD